MAMEKNNTFENISLVVNILLEIKGYLLADFLLDFEKKKEIYVFLLLLNFFLLISNVLKTGEDTEGRQS